MAANSEGLATPHTQSQIGSISNDRLVARGSGGVAPSPPADTPPMPPPTHLVHDDPDDYFFEEEAIDECLLATPGPQHANSGSFGGSSRSIHEARRRRALTTLSPASRKLTESLRPLLSRQQAEAAERNSLHVDARQSRINNRSRTMSHNFGGRRRSNSNNSLSSSGGRMICGS
eukprot:Filipodium_phascolosomae@DN5862_c0_g1_i1.p1